MADEPKETINCQYEPRDEERNEASTIDAARHAPPDAAKVLVVLEYLFHVCWRLLVLPTAMNNGEHILHRDSSDQQHAHLLHPIMECNIRSLLDGRWA
jgi:hypothetical protein